MLQLFTEYWLHKVEDVFGTVDDDETKYTGIWGVDRRDEPEGTAERIRAWSLRLAREGRAEEMSPYDSGWLVDCLLVVLVVHIMIPCAG